MRKATCSSRTAGAAFAHRRGGSRRGVLLLIVLSLLAMFALIGLTFVILTNHARRSAETAGRAEQYAKGPEDKAEMALMQCVRGTNNPASVLRNHSLLEDLYGYDPTVPFFTVNGVANATTGGQLVNVTITPGLTATLGNRLSVVGRVLTFTTGLARGKSTRVVGCIDDTTIQIVGVPDVAVNDQFVLNGLPFSGTGFGYNPTAGITPPDEPLLGALDVSGLPYALLPNPVSFVPQGSYLDPSGPGGANEDYDAADYQNMLLALQDPTSNTTPIPSLHRPALVYYWFRQLLSNTPAWFDWPTNANTDDLKLQAFLTPTAVDASNNPIWSWNDINHRDRLAALKRRIILRPSQDDHPNFTGSNPLSPYVVGFLADGTLTFNWDIDNDGDGTPDSIWVDAGLPVQSTKEGVLYKPLVAILCVDLDGRLNLNAHGNLSQASAGFQTPTTLPAAIAAGGLSVLPEPSLVVRGQGVGPAEVNLNALFANVPNDPPHLQYQNLLYGHGYADPAGPQTPGRYAEVVDPASGTPAVGRPTDRSLFANRMFDYPNGYNVAAWATTDFLSYGTPMDLTSSIAVGLDLRGQPLYVPYNASTCTTNNNPYQMNLSGAASTPISFPWFGAAPSNATFVEAPFTVNELEGLLRWYDVDAGTLPGRLTALAPLLRDRSREVTTESWSVPCPAVALPPELRADPAAFAALNNGKAGHLVDLLRARLFKENTSLDPSNPTHVQTVETMMTQLVSPDTMMGLRFDLNRLFGNGRDNPGSSNGVIDEPWEADVSLGSPDQSFPQVNAAGGDATTAVLDPDNDGLVGTDYANTYYARERQDYARHLYVKMLLLMNYEVASAGNPTQAEKDTARMVAQWAINIVDFRDRDSIMTPFEYDIDPFRDNNSDGNPWDVDGVIGAPSTDDTAAHRGLVWGCERPELLITETLAFHDQKAEDTDQDNDKGAVVGTGTDDDDDYDQRVRPQGSLFVELYNPTTTNEPLPGEFYGFTQELRLDATVNNSPVWRLIIVTGAGLAKDPDDPDDPPDAADIVRSIYFVNGLNPGMDLGSDGTRFLAEATMAPLLPDRYAVIGPSHPLQASEPGTTHVGDKTDGTLSDRQIVLTPDVNADQPNQVRIDGNGKTVPTPDMPVGVKPPIAIRVPNLNVSEPLPGDPDDYPVIDGTVVFDQPFDYARDPMFGQPGTTAGVFRIHLQRLANPLMPYDADTNPYRTVDAMPIDLTTFNGSEATRDPILESSTKKTVFESHQRGDIETSDVAVVGSHNLWAQPSKPKPMSADSPQETPVQHKFPHILGHSLGYLTDDFGPPLTGPTGYEGSPQQAFPWLPWLNRPFTSAGELTLVPKWRSSLLLKGASIGSAVSNPYKNPAQPFGHLINFWYDDTTANPLTATPNWKLHRLLEFVHVPSRFVGTELQGSPMAFTENTPTPNHSFHPPFNRISNYREPGKVNLNTITSPRVWQGLLGGIVSPTFGQFVASRRGYGTAGDDWSLLDATTPTRFANPFRSFAGKYLVPTTGLRDAIGEEVNATMLRPVTTTGNSPLFDFASLQPVNDTNRNPAFRNQLLARLDNVATNRSNVYAIWITVGYFEVTPIAPSAIYPDGYQLGRELGSDSGEATRHRAFYIIDRSIPVGFQRGEDLNSRDTILLRRNIE